MRIDYLPAGLIYAWRRIILLALLGLAACAPGAAPTAEPAGLVVTAPRGPLSQALESAAAAYGQESGETVRVEALGAEEYGTQVHAALLAGLDRYDLVYLSAEGLARWAAYHAIQPLQAELDRAALAAWLPAVSVDGEIYGLPTQPDPAGLWYRADLLEGAGLGVPRDWEAFRRAAQVLNAPPGRYGAAIAGSDIDAAADFTALLAGFGGQAVGAGRQVEIDSDAARRALNFYAGFVQDESLVGPGAERATRADVLDSLREGRAALGIAPLSAGRQLLDCSASPRVCQDGKAQLAWAWLPGLDERTAVGSLGAWALPLKAAHAGQAQRFIAWLGSEAGARAWARAGGIPAHPAVLAGLPGAESLAGVGEYRLAFPQVATVDLLWKASSAAVNAAVSGQQPPEKALEAAAEEMRSALRQAGY